MNRIEPERELRVAIWMSAQEFGGAERYLVQLYSELRKKGIRPTVLGAAPDWPPTLGGVLPVGAGLKLTKRRPIVPQLISAVRGALAVRRYLQSHRFDAVHVQFMREKLLLSLAVPRKLPVMWTEHGPLPENLPRLARLLFSWQARRARVIAVSTGVRESLARAGVFARVIPNPLPADGSEASDSAQRTVLYGGRLHSLKRVELLVEAMRLLPEWRAVIAGDGPARATLEASATENVKFVGHQRDLRPLLNETEFVVLTSGRAAREGSPMMLLEARSAGVCVLAAEDSHASAEAQELGAVLFEPSARILADTLQAHSGKGRRLLPEQVRVARSSEVWASEYEHELMRLRGR